MSFTIETSVVNHSKIIERAAPDPKMTGKTRNKLVRSKTLMALNLIGYSITKDSLFC